MQNIIEKNIVFIKLKYIFVILWQIKLLLMKLFESYFLKIEFNGVVESFCKM